VKITRTKWWKLKWDVSQVFKNIVIAEGSWNEGEDADNMWKEMTTHIRKVAIVVFGVIRGNKRKPKDTWWWNDDIQKAISEKKNATNVYITTRVMKTYRSTKKPEETQRKL
jgi:hypothetical protein